MGPHTTLPLKLSKETLNGTIFFGARDLKFYAFLQKLLCRTPKRPLKEFDWRGQGNRV